MNKTKTTITYGQREHKRTYGAYRINSDFLVPGIGVVKTKDRKWFVVCLITGTLLFKIDRIKDIEAHSDTIRSMAERARLYPAVNHMIATIEDRRK